LRWFGSQLSDDHELRGCGRKIRKGQVGSATEILEVTTSCRRKWLCPKCGHAESQKEAAKLKCRLLGWRAQGHAAALLTLTQCHGTGDRLAALWDRLEAGWAALVRGSGWTADKRAHGVRGYVRITEVAHSHKTGWHVHFHVILLLDRELDPLAMDGLKASLTDRFARGVARSGGRATVDGQDLRPMTPGTEGTLANYLLKGTTIYRPTDGSRTPMAILDDLEVTGEGLVLWDELTATVSDARRMQVSHSNGIDALCSPTSTTILDK
jgi:Replication protein